MEHKIAKWAVVTPAVIGRKAKAKMVSRSIIVHRRKRALEKEKILGKIVVHDLGEIM